MLKGLGTCQANFMDLSCVHVVFVRSNERTRPFCFKSSVHVLMIQSPEFKVSWNKHSVSPLHPLLEPLSPVCPVRSEFYL
jgi:hypothetical protein